MDWTRQLEKYRFKTQDEMIKEYGVEKWMEGGGTISLVSEMNYFLGKNLNDFNVVRIYGHSHIHVEDLNCERGYWIVARWMLTEIEEKEVVIDESISSTIDFDFLRI